MRLMACVGMARVGQTILILSLCCTVQALQIARDDGDCKCLGWKDAYQIHQADCSHMGDETCDKFFKNLPNEVFCVNEGFHKEEPRQWCYVSSSCASGQTLTWRSASDTNTAKFKWCGADEPKLADKTPVELRAWTEKNDLEIGLGVHFAYPTLPEKLTNDVLEFFGISAPADAPPAEFHSPPLSEDLRQRLQKRADEGRRTLIISTAGHPPFGIMEGKKLYWLNFSDKQMELLKNNQDFWSHKGIMNNVLCVAGCETAVAPWMSPINAYLR